MVVGRFDSVGVGEGPEAWPALEKVAREVAVILGARALAGGVLEQCAQLVLERGDLRLQSGAVAVGLVGVPGGEEVAGDLEAVAAELFLFCNTFAVAGEVAQEVGPAELPLARVEVVVAAPAVGADDPGEPLAEQRPGLERVPAGRDPEHGGPARQRTPEGAAAAGGLPAGLVDVDGRGCLDPLLELGVGAGEGIAGALDDRINRPGRKLDAEQFPRELGRVAPRDAVADCERQDRKSTRVNSSHEWISYAVVCLKRKSQRSGRSNGHYFDLARKVQLAHETAR